MAALSNTEIEAAAWEVLGKPDHIRFPDFMNAVVQELACPAKDKANALIDIFRWLMAQEHICITGTMDVAKAQAREKEKSKKEAAPLTTPLKRKIAPDEFVYRAIEKLRDPRYTAIHTVISGFNEAFREFYKDEGLDPVTEVERMVAEGTLKRRFVKRGCLISNDPRFRGGTSRRDTLKKMGIAG